MSSDQLIIFDTTLRDGEQSPGIALTPSEKLLIAQQLEKLKVDVIEAGFAASSPGDWDGVNLIANNINGSTIASLARCVPDDIEQAWEAIKVADKSRIHVFTSTSDIHMEHMLRKTKEEVLKDARESVKYAKKLCDDVEFSAQDATRTDKDFLIEMASSFPNKIVLGLDARQGRVATHGWASVEKELAVDVAFAVKDLPLAGIVYTDIERDGMMSGVNGKSTLEIAKKSGIPTIASGGINELSDLEGLKSIFRENNSLLLGVITGRAIYEGKLNFKEGQQLLDR